jgi:HD-GYP domain-containing protein (c-di-GMP phosphodiesterase class II)
MLRMSEILKKAEQEKLADSLLDPPLQSSPPEPVTEKLKPESKAYEATSSEVEDRKLEETEISEVRISPVIMNEAKVASDTETLNLYTETVSLMREILQVYQNCGYIDTDRIKTQAERIVDQLSLNNEKLLPLALTEECKDADYLSYHSVNVCILSIEVGLGLDYTKPKLIELGNSALLHDIGMVKYLHLCKQSDKLTASEYRGLKDHPTKGIEILKKIKNLDQMTLDVVHQHHERSDGSGYPRGIKGESINEYAKIVGLVDVYEAMIHHRPYRDKLLPLQAMREILKKKNAFGKRLIKILIEKIGIYPLGSLVVLNTKERAEVVKLNHSVW